MTAKPRRTEGPPTALVRLRRERDPEILRRELPGIAAGLGAEGPAATRPVVAPDLGTACVYAIAWLRPGEPFDPRRGDPGPARPLGRPRFDSGALRFVRLRQFLAVIRPAPVLFEGVRYTPPESLRRPARRPSSPAPRRRSNGSAA